MRGELALLLLAACTREQDRIALPPLSPAPEVPDLPEAPPRGDSRSYALDLPGGGSGAPFGSSFFFPPGSSARGVAGELSDGSRGLRLSVDAPGDALACTPQQRLHDKLTVGARLRVVALEGVNAPWKGVVSEVRARDADGKLVQGNGERFVTLWRGDAAGDWQQASWEASLPAGTEQGQVCFRFVGTTGTIEIDSVDVLSVGTPLPPAASAMSLRWELDHSPAANVAPEGFEFFYPPGSRGARIRVGDLAEAGSRGIRFESEVPGNVVTCSIPLTTGAAMVARARVRIEALKTDLRTWTGFVMEMRTHDAIGALLSPAGGLPYTTLKAWKEPGPPGEVEVAFEPPDGATSGKLCFRFVESSGVAEIDWASVGGV